MPQPLTTQETSRGKSHAAQAYWDRVLDPANLERPNAPGGQTPAADLEREILLAQSPDFQMAAAWLEGAPVRKAPSAAPRAEPVTLDLGAGLGAHAFALARRGHLVVALDSSAARLGELQQRAARCGVADHIRCIVAAAEHLPLRDACLGGLFTKSVLIHTDLPRAAGEIGRVLAPLGRAALIEPRPGNPFAWLYRRTLAPRAWRAITTYFGPREQIECVRAIEGAPHPAFPVGWHYLFGFLAFIFQFALPSPGLFRLALRCAAPVDRFLFTLLPWTRRLAWFGVIRLQRPPGER